MSAPTKEQIQSAIATVARRATKDQSFREKALKEPIAAINEAGNLDLPLETPIRFIAKFEKLNIMLPPFGSDPNEITDEEMLGSVSGGITPTTFVVLATVGLTAAAVTFTKGVADELWGKR